MTADPAKPRRTRKSHRCTHRSAAGSRCRAQVFHGGSPGRPAEILCPAHSQAEVARREADELTVALTGGLDAFTAAATVNQFLSRLLLLLAQDRISPRRAAVMAYTAHLILRTLPAIEKENAPAVSNQRPTIIWDIPGPAREQNDLPEHATTRTSA